MTDFTNHPKVMGGHSRKTAHQREYYAYFALIFVATLPLALLTWVLSTARRMEFPDRGPIKSALSQAHIITPRIFSA